MSENGSMSRKGRGPGFIWPIILITVGILFLLNNLGWVQGDFWSLVWRFWPVVLIAIGLDGLFRRSEITGPVFMIGLGSVILLSNIGLIGWGLWNILWRLWPVLLVAAGLEIIFRRRSLWVSILAVVLILAVLGGILWGSGTGSSRGEMLGSTVVDQAPGEITAAAIEIKPAAGKLVVERLADSQSLIQGEVDLQGRTDIYTNYQVKENRGFFTIDSRPFNNFPSTGSLIWDLGITDRFPIEFTVSMGAGEIVLDLSGLSLTSIDISQGVGDISLVLQENGSYDIEVSQAIGSISIDLPGNTGVRIQVDRAITNLDLPSGYERVGDDYFSPGYDSMEHKINLQISQAIGNIEVRE